jgi:putative addiction module antidote
LICATRQVSNKLNLQGVCQMKTDVTKIGDSLAVTVPEELAGKLGIKPGDTVFLTETKDGLEITTQAPSEYDEQLAVGRAFVDRHKKAFQLLATR